MRLASISGPHRLGASTSEPRRCGVFVDFELSQIRKILEQTGISWAQLHGAEAPELVQALLPHAYKAIGVKDGSVVELARRYPGEHLLLDASVPGMPGGTGRTFDWSIAAEVAKENGNGRG